MEELARWHAFLLSLSSKVIISFGDNKLTLGILVTLVALFILLFAAAGLLRRLLEKRLLPRAGFDASVSIAIASISRYAILAFGTVVVLQTVGIDMSAFSVLAGTIGIGIGLGLQGIANNFISGIVILFERPVKVGDRIEVGSVLGNVTAINMRSLTVLTNDNINIIIPNANILNENVVNWSYSDRTVRFKVPIGVAYGSNVREVEKILLEVAHSVPEILKDPAPAVVLIGFGDSSINFELRVWSSTFMERKSDLKSLVNFGIAAAFEKHGIEIPFPQRDLHIKTADKNSVAQLLKNSVVE